MELKLNDAAKNVFKCMLGVNAETMNDVKDVLDRASTVKRFSDETRIGIRKAFADAGMGVTPADTFASQNESSNMPEPIPATDELRGLAITQTAEEKPEEEKKEEEAKSEDKGQTQQTPKQEKAEVAEVIDSVKKVIDAEGTAKEIKKQGEEIIAELEAHVKSLENAKAFIKDNAVAEEALETPEEEKKEEKAEEKKEGEEMVPPLDMKA